MFNKVVLLGNLTRDVEIRYSQSNSAIAKTAIATSRKFTANGEKKEEVCFVDLTFFGKSGEIAHQYLKKGSKVLIEGRLLFEQWSDTSGQKHSKHSVIVENMQMVDSKSNTSKDGDEESYSQAQKIQSDIPSKPMLSIQSSNPFDDQIKDEQIPF
jgi:single-strand DNA-binding protein